MFDRWLIKIMASYDTPFFCPPVPAGAPSKRDDRAVRGGAAVSARAIN